jgi:hypothetical protein
MIWHYRCPSCSQQLEANWDWHREEVTCPQCRNRHYPPTPHEDRYAWFGGDKWPQEMADAVVAVRGTTCAVPGCYQAYDVMVHRKPMAKGGRTSVDNLLPMCTRHARLKGGQDYDEWLRTQPEVASVTQAEPIKITITPKQPAPPPEPIARYIGFCQPVAGMVKPPPLPAGLRLVTATPFLPGPARRLLLSYDWRLESDGSARVVLFAWPHDHPPEVASGTQGCPQAANQHSGRAGESGTASLELGLTGPADHGWTAALALEDPDGRLVLEQYLLSLTD